MFDALFLLHGLGLLGLVLLHLLLDALEDLVECAHLFHIELLILLLVAIVTRVGVMQNGAPRHVIVLVFAEYWLSKAGSVFLTVLCQLLDRCHLRQVSSLSFGSCLAEVVGLSVLLAGLSSV